MKLYVMTEMGILPTEKRVKEMSWLQWAILFKFLIWKEKREYLKNLDFWRSILGLGGKRSLIPLSVFIQPEAGEEIISMMREDIGEEVSDFDKESEELEKIFMSDIDILVEGKLNEVDEAELDGIEEKLGVIKEDG